MKYGAKTNTLLEIQKLYTPWSNHMSGIIPVDSGWIRKGPKSADFEQKAWGFEYEVLVSAGNRSQTPWNASYMLTYGFLSACRIVPVDFVWIRKGT